MAIKAKSKPAPKKKARRAIGAATSKEVPVVLQRNAVEHYINNKKMNAHKGVSDKARKALFQGMEEEGLKSFEVEASLDDGTPVILSVDIASKPKQVVNIEKLSKAVDAETLKLIVSATKKAVEDYAGKDVFLRCAEIEDGDPNVTVKPKG